MGRLGKISALRDFLGDHLGEDLLGGGGTCSEGSGRNGEWSGSELSVTCPGSPRRACPLPRPWYLQGDF